jgi:hypothetical protein
MSHGGARALGIAVLLAGCAAEPAARSAVPAREPLPSEIVFQAVDAGTGAALMDRQMTVRYLVRTPITLDTTAVESVASSQPYRVAHPVASDSLVLEVRLEAESYFRHDTVLSVPRGSSAGPFTLRMARRLDRVAQAPDRSPTAPTRPAPGASAPAPAVTRPGATRPRPAAGFDRSAVAAGDRAFRNADWGAAAEAYGRMGAPTQRTGADADAYAQALVRLGVSQMNVGAYGGALEALELAVAMPASGYAAHLHLGRAQCHVGRIEEGRSTLAGVDRLTIPAGERPGALALVEYGRGLCSEAEFDRAEGAINRVRTGSAAVRQFETFVQRGESVSPRTPELTAALADARTRITGIQQRVRGG